MKKIYIGLLALALTSVSCRYHLSTDINPENNHCLNLYFEAREIASEKKDSDIIKELSQDNWCDGHKRSISKDIDVLEDYINSKK